MSPCNKGIRVIHVAMVAVPGTTVSVRVPAAVGRGLHSFTLELNLSNSSTHS